MRIFGPAQSVIPLLRCLKTTYLMKNRGDLQVKRRILIAVAFTLIAGVVFGADAVVGTWKTQEGEISVIDRCGSDYCIVAKSGQYAGQKIGTFAASAGTYNGQITDPRNKAIYSGKLTVSGDSLKLRGCATNVLCKTQTWTRIGQ